MSRRIIIHNYFPARRKTQDVNQRAVAEIAQLEKDIERHEKAGNTGEVWRLSRRLYELQSENGIGDSMGSELTVNNGDAVKTPAGNGWVAECMGDRVKVELIDGSKKTFPVASVSKIIRPA